MDRIKERGANSVVATPGRLCDLLERKQLSFKRLELVVMDEADKLLEHGNLGFIALINMGAAHPFVDVAGKVDANLRANTVFEGVD